MQLKRLCKDDIVKDSDGNDMGFYLCRSPLGNFNKELDIFKKKFILSGTKIYYNENGKKRGAKVVAVDTSNGTLMVSAKGGKVKRLTYQPTFNQTRRQSLQRIFDNRQALVRALVVRQPKTV